LSGESAGTQSEDDEALGISSIPEEYKAEMRRARLSVERAQAFGSRRLYACRIQPIAAALYVAERGGLLPAGRSTPETVERQFMQGRPVAERERVVRELWRIFEEESRVLGRLAKRSQEVISARVEFKRASRDVVAIELRDGDLYVVQRGEDGELDFILKELERLDALRQEVIAPYVPHDGSD